MSKKARLLHDLDVKRWYTDVGRGSPVTADVHLRRLSLFCDQNKLSPGELANLGRRDRKKLDDLMQDHVTRMELEKKSPGYIGGMMKGVKSWLAHNDIELKRKIRISNLGATPSIENERVPDKEELKALFMYGDERASALICLVAQSGLRLEVLGNSRGDDGLTIGDLPELKVKEARAEFSKVPTMVVVRSVLSKANFKYFTFLPKEGCDFLAGYLNGRIAQNEKLTPETPVIATKPGYRDEGDTDSLFMTTRNVSRIIRDVMRPRFRWRPYVLRAYFATQMTLAESHGKMAHPYRVFFMGHKGDMEARYSTNKGRLPDNLIEDMRNAFAASCEYIETTLRLEKDKREMLLEMWREQAKVYGIDPMKVKIEREKELEKRLTLDEEQELLTSEIRKMTVSRLSSNGKPYQGRVIAEKELADFIEEGWEIVKELRNRRFLIRKSNHVA